MKKKLLILFLFLFVVFSFFTPYFLGNKWLFPGNLLVSFYSPWKYETFSRWEGGIPNKPIGFDNLRFFFPIRKEILKQIQSHKVPLWNPYNFSGNVLLADSQSAVFYPLNFLFLFFPFMESWSLLVIFVPTIAGIFTYLFLRTYRLQAVSSFFGAFGFAFSGFMVAWMEENPAVSHSAIWLPVALYGIRQFLLTKFIRFWLLTILSLVFSILAGFFQISLYLWIFVFSFGLYELWKMNGVWRKKMFFPVLMIFMFAVSIAAIHLLPSFEGYLNSPRITASATYLAKEYLTPLSHLITLVAPDIYGNPGTYNYFGGGFHYDKILYAGLIPLVFCFYAVFSRAKNSRFFLFWGVLTLVLGFANPLSKLLIHLKIPFFSLVTPSRIFYLTDFAIIVLAALGLDSYLKNQNRASLKKSIIMVFSIFVTAGLVILRLLQLAQGKATALTPLDLTTVFIATRNLIIPLSVFIFTCLIMFWWFKKKKYGLYLSIILVILSIVHQNYFFKKVLYETSDQRFVFPETQVIRYFLENTSLERILGVGQARIFPNLLLPYRLFSTDGLDPVFPRRYGEFINVVNGGDYSTDIPRIEARFFLEKEEDFLNERKLKTLSFLGIKYLLVPLKAEEKDHQNFSLPRKQFQKVFTDHKVAIWENKEVFPRCWIVNNFVVRKKDEDILKTIFAADFNLKKSVVLEEKPPIKLNNSELNEGKVEIMEYNPDTIRIKTKSVNKSILFCTENFYPGWKAKIDPSTSSEQAETKIYRANYSFRSVLIPEGDHEIVFRYEPLSFKVGAVISILGLLETIAFGVLSSQKRKEEKNFSNIS